MAITEHVLQGAEGKIGTLEDFGTLTFIEDALSTELEDGRPDLPRCRKPLLF